MAAYGITFCLHLLVQAATAVASQMTEEDFSNCFGLVARVRLRTSFQRIVIGACADLKYPAQSFDREQVRLFFNELENRF